MGSWVEKERKQEGDPLLLAELEAELTRHVREIMRAYKKYNPDGEYLAFCIIDNEMEAHNRWWNTDKEHPVKMKGRWVG